MASRERRVPGGRVGVVLMALLIAASPAVGEPPRGSAASSVGGFYVVQGNGELRAEDPVRSGFAVGADRRLSGPADPRRRVRVTGSPPAPATPARPPTGATEAPARDEFAAFRCEGAGLYYAKDGRCVVPARRVDRRPPLNPPPARPR